MELSAAVENYLKTILVLSKKNHVLRAVDICEELGYSRPTISVVLKKMKNNGLILIDEHKRITLTDSGRQAAEKIYEKHTVLSELFVKIGVDKKTASFDACKVEHDISDETFERIKNLSQLL